MARNISTTDLQEHYHIDASYIKLWKDPKHKGHKVYLALRGWLALEDLQKERKSKKQ